MNDRHPSPTPSGRDLAPEELEVACRPRLVLARHGRTAWNAEGRFQGHADPPLDSIGRYQAHRLATQLAPLRPDLVMTSDLRRARSTAEYVATASKVVVNVDSKLREVSLGEWEGLDRTEAHARFPIEYQAWRSGQPIRRGGGESEAEAGQRAAAAIGRAMVEQRGLVVVIAHGLVLQSAMSFLAGDGWIRLRGTALHLANGDFVAFTDDGVPWCQSKVSIGFSTDPYN